MKIRETFISEYRALNDAIARCHNENHLYYGDYGGRGLYVCPAWREYLRGFERFLAYMGPKPSASHSIDRIDNDGSYVPGNLRWATKAEQVANRRKMGTSARLKVRNETIKRERDEGLSAQEIAERHMLTVSQINRILAGQR